MTDVQSPFRRALVVCPTEYGGHLEHAADTALALAARSDMDRVVLLSRAGAKRYLGPMDVPKLEIIETIPPRRPRTTSKVHRILRAGKQMVDLAQEHWCIRSCARALGDRTAIVFDSSRYPRPGLLRTDKSQGLILFQHNATPHLDKYEITLTQRFNLALEKACVRRVDRVITHGERQRGMIRNHANTEVLAVALPQSTRLHASSRRETFEHTHTHTELELPAPDALYALCIGALRSNKGIEYAITAAGRARVPLRVHGACDDPRMTAEFASMAEKSGVTTYVDRFLEKHDFNYLIEHATLILLPYTHFDAQSGVLSKAMQAGLRVVASDLPAIREQAQGYARITFAAPRNTLDLAHAMREAFQAALHDDPAAPMPARKADHDDWAQVAAAVVGLPETSKASRHEMRDR